MNADTQPGAVLSGSTLEYYQAALDIHNGSMSDKVLRFMIAMDQLPILPGTPIPKEDFELARKLIKEEFEREFKPAFDRFEISQSLENLTELVDGAMDTIYVVIWAMVKFGVPVDRCFGEVQRSNMAKLNADGTVTKNAFGKVQKPEGWTPPDIFGILVDHYDPAVWHGNMRTHTRRAGDL